jgi:hypothetical protein
VRVAPKFLPAKCCASGNPCQVQNFEPAARQLYSGKPYLVKYIFSGGQQTIKTLHLLNFFKFCIIIHTDKKGTEMTDHEFYAQIQEDYFREFAGAELSEVFVCTNDHDEFFEFDDVPF